MLGAAFKRQVKTDSKTELLIFLTPHVIERPRDLVAMTRDSAGRLQMAPKTFSEQELNRYLEGMPVNPPTINTTPPASAPPVKQPASKPSRR